MTRFGTLAAALVGVAVLATPALPVTVENTQWATSGRSIAKVKGLGKAKGDASLLVTFFAGGDATAEDAFDREFSGGYVVTGRKRNKVEFSLDTASTSLLESVIESDVEAAVLRKAGRSVEVTADITTVTAKASFNKKGTKMRFKLKAKAVGSADIDLERRRATYTVRTKGEPTF